MYLTVNTVSELICFLVGSFCLYRDKEPAWRLFIPYLLVVCTVEAAGIYIRKVLHLSNIPIYNLFMLIECGIITTFFSYLYKQYISVRYLLPGWIALFLALYITEIYTHRLAAFANNTATVMSIVFVLASLYYYYLILKDEKYFQLGSYAPFWWVNGTLLYYFGSTATNFFFDFLIHDQIAAFPYSIRYIIFNILNVLLYCCWSYAFICRYRQRRSTSLSV
ncbi:hypothetical protein [Chitinophaga vietnamensis]|uniref:hypothetical protein n=1 Tax=Chitinophaga vietnamensis TaxID=2593957 RepID=UPI0011789B99|nr:hypothetical protein [Chitinophaga vietnamensis]